MLVPAPPCVAGTMKSENHLPIETSVAALIKILIMSSLIKV